VSRLERIAQLGTLNPPYFWLGADAEAVEADIMRHMLRSVFDDVGQQYRSTHHWWRSVWR